MKIRYRTKNRWFRRPLLVVQVSESVPYNFDPATDIKPGGYCEGWRDARVEDLGPFGDE